ncbi:hypothetical protein ONZ43_g7572 [Nemania bipapillata]|uniref:Uncharacterized protein n=1 Tax=Nemania bipapillata TaxID=110536 RepID=A0ACC2HQ25_9PEZI|nr:hypothetical protein ONZ43_g7572 [Nemania bipapillata]
MTPMTPRQDEAGLLPTLQREPYLKPVERVTDQLEIPSLDDRQYRVIRLSNKLEALLVQDPETDKASAALDVHVGNFSDEDTMPGMAHAVEHLLFMGTKKFPEENAYNVYLSSHSGSSNAYTGSTSTNYYFDISAKPSNGEAPSETNVSPLYGGLDRFAQFFIEPLFLPSTLDRELRAVDSENKKNLQSDQWRNLEVLKTIPESQDIDGLKNYKEVVKVFFQYVSLLRQMPPQEWIYNEQRELSEVDFKFKQKSPASRFTSKISSVMQRPLPREWLLSGQSRLRKFNPTMIEKGISLLRPDNMRMTIVSRDYPGDWDKKEKWYGTEYKSEKIPEKFLAELSAALATPAGEQLPALHVPHKNQFIPTKLEVEKKEVEKPATAPRVIRNDSIARTWWKKDDTFWVPKASLIVSMKNPIVYASVKNSVKTKFFTDLVRDALEEYSYDAELAGLQYNVNLDSRGLLVEVSGYNDKLAVLLEQVLITMRDLVVKEDRFEIIKERLTRGYKNCELQQPFTQIGDYVSWLTSEHDYVVEQLSVELPSITAEDVRSFHKQIIINLETSRLA